MKVLGIHDGHNASAALVDDGVVVAALQEERLTRLKNEFSFPHLALEWVLRSTGTDPSEIDAVAMASKHVPSGWTREELLASYAASQGLPPQHQTMTNYWNDDPLRGPAWTCAEALYRASDIQPEDVKVAQLYDAFTPLVILSLEGYGFCKRGEGADFTNDGNIGIGGRLPVNTSGGGLSEAYVHGFNLINEGVRQMRGTSCNQVENADSCLVTAGEGVPTSAMLLRS